VASARRREAEHILKLCLGDHLRAFELVERQLGVLVLRAQVMLSLCGIVITVTGFSGRAIAETSHAARISVAAGIFMVLAAAAVAIWGVLRLRWLTQEIDDEPLVTLLRGLEVRDRKARNMRVAATIFVIGFGLYCAAIAQLLIATRPITP
jgi:hypothetical protein